MNYYYSSSTGGFYYTQLHPHLPNDAVQISADEHQHLLAGQSAGARIIPGPDGQPVLTYDAAPQDTVADLERWRASAQISRFQARAALMQAGLLDQVEAAVAASDDPLIALAWADTTVWPRTSPTIAALADTVGLTGAQIDDLFRAAAQIQA